MYSIWIGNFIIFRGILSTMYICEHARLKRKRQKNKTRDCISWLQIVSIDSDIYHPHGAFTYYALGMHISTSYIYRHIDKYTCCMLYVCCLSVCICTYIRMQTVDPHLFYENFRVMGLWFWSFSRKRHSTPNNNI